MIDRHGCTSSGGSPRRPPRIIRSPGARLIHDADRSADQVRSAHREAYEELAPFARANSATSASSPIDGQLYVLGGTVERVDANTSDRFYRYDPDSDSLDLACRTCPAARAAMAVGVIGRPADHGRGAPSTACRPPTTFATTRRGPRVVAPARHGQQDASTSARRSRAETSTCSVAAPRSRSRSTRPNASTPPPRTAGKSWRRCRFPPAGWPPTCPTVDSVIAIGGGDDGGGRRSPTPYRSSTPRAG